MRLVILVRVLLSRGPEPVSMTVASVGVLRARVNALFWPAGGAMVVQRQVQRDEKLLKQETHARERSHEHSQCLSSTLDDHLCLCLPQLSALRGNHSIRGSPVPARARDPVGQLRSCGGQAYGSGADIRFAARCSKPPTPPG